MAFLGFVLARFFDPVGFLVVLIIVRFSPRNNWVIFASAAVGAVSSETALVMTHSTHSWGDALPYGLTAGLMHALLCYWFVGAVEKRKQKAQRKNQ